MIVLLVVALLFTICSGSCDTADGKCSTTPALSSRLSSDLIYYNRTIWSPEGRHYIFTDIMAKHGWFVVYHADNATLLWTTGYSDMPKRVLRDLRLGNGQIWNQIEDSWAISNKERLHDLLARAGKTYLQPPTYGLSDEKECVEFFKVAAQKPDAVWVAKDPQGSQGDGITINIDVNVLRQAWLVNPDATGNNIECVEAEESKREDTVVQEYILNPLTLEGKKMEIRTYWFVTLDPFHVFYHDGTVRLTTRDYKLDDWSDPLIHITNTKQQEKADPNFKQTESERKWVLDDLGTYLQEKGKVTDGAKWLNDLRDTLKEYIATVILAGRPYFMSLRPAQGWDGRFEIFGMDVILDQDLRVWMTEIQDAPSISPDPGTVKEKIIPEMLTEVVDIVLEIDQSARFGLVEEKPLRSLKNWHEIDVEKYKKTSQKD